MLNLSQKADLQALQNYVAELERERGFDKQEAIHKCLLLGEEVGELFKAVRKFEKELRMDKNSAVGSVEDELADVLIYLCSIANKFSVDLETAFRNKEEKNKARTWESSRLEDTIVAG
jgi:NTP pyrophosphatase (non-canonical NTP hydrolase)